MKYPQEVHAQDLHQLLTQRFTGRTPATTLTITGTGTQCRCTAMCGHNFCRVACFDVGGPEYLTSFERNSEKIAAGRTSSKLDTVDAIEAWLQDQPLSRLYDRFHFVDQSKRSLACLRDALLAQVPDLPANAATELQHLGSGSYHLWFRSVDRSCRISFYSNDQFPTAAFHWDDCELFRIQAGDQKQLAALLKRWLCDRAMPSELRTEFPAIEIGKLADYYEQGRPIEGEFITSWDQIERFYDKLRLQQYEQVLELIAQIRRTGYDKTLRAGQSMWTLVVSRSRRHGLREDQPSIAFSFPKAGMEVCANFNETSNLTYPEVKFTPDIDLLLKHLEAKPID